MASLLLSLHLLKVCCCLAIEGGVSWHSDDQHCLIAQQAHAVRYGDLPGVYPLQEVDNGLMRGLGLWVGQYCSLVGLD